MRKMVVLLTLFATLSLPSCAAWKDNGSALLAEAKVGLAAAGKDVAKAVGEELRVTGREVIVTAREELAKAGGDLKEAAGATLSQIPELAKAGGEKAAAEVIAKRLDLEDPGRAEEYRRRAAGDGLGAANEWAFGGGLTGVLAILGLFWRTRRGVAAEKALAKVVAAVEGSEAAPAIKAAVAATGGKSAPLAAAIERAKAA